MPDAFQAFHESIRLAELSISRGQLNLAKDQYSQLLLTYNQLMSLPGDPEQKANAHMALSKVYNMLCNPNLTSTVMQQFSSSQGARMQTSSGIGITTPTKEPNQKTSVPTYCAVLLLLAFSIAVFIKPEFIGMATFEGTPRISEDLSLQFSESGSKIVSLKHIPSGIGISGKITKTQDTGWIKIFVQNGRKQLLFDSTQTSLVNGVFSNQCVECALPGYSSKDVTLVVEVQNASVELTSITYTVQEQHNTAPEWTGGEKVMRITGKTSIDLSKNFKDKELDDLVFLVTQESQDLEITLELNKLTLLPKKAGKYSITLIASDLLKVTKVPIQVEAQ